jgi:uncharacterized protein (DUF2062 family)
LRWINIAVVLLPMLLQLIIWGLFLFVVTRLAFSGYWRTHLELMHARRCRACMRRRGSVQHEH